jgi:hypothetical protein
LRKHFSQLGHCGTFWDIPLRREDVKAGERRRGGGAGTDGLVKREHATFPFRVKLGRLGSAVRGANPTRILEYVYVFGRAFVRVN